MTERQAAPAPRVSAAQPRHSQASARAGSAARRARRTEPCGPGLGAGDLLKTNAELKDNQIARAEPFLQPDISSVINAALQ